MGEEYGETAPFPYFVDHGDPALVEAVRAGAPRSSRIVAAPSELLDPADPATFDAAARLDHTLLARAAVHRDTVASLSRPHRAAAIDARPFAARPALSVRAWADGDVLVMVRSHDRGDVIGLVQLRPGSTKVATACPPERAWRLMVAAFDEPRGGPDGRARRHSAPGSYRVFAIEEVGE